MVVCGIILIVSFRYCNKCTRNLTIQGKTQLCIKPPGFLVQFFSTNYVNDLINRYVRKSRTLEPTVNVTILSCSKRKTLKTRNFKSTFPCEHKPLNQRSPKIIIYSQNTFQITNITICSSSHFLVIPV